MEAQVLELWLDKKSPKKKSYNLCVAKKLAKSYKEFTAANQYRSGSEVNRFKTWCQQVLFTAVYLLKSTLPLVMGVHKNYNSF